MKKKILSLLLVISILLLSIRPVGAEVIPIYAGVNYIDDLVTIPVNLSSNNYSVYINTQGYISVSFVHSTFDISRGGVIYFTLTINDNSENSEVERRLVLPEAGEYTFTFYLWSDSSFYGVQGDDYLNYEVLLAETVIIYQPKTSIIAEAPYGIVIIFVALIGVTIVQLRKRREK